MKDVRKNLESEDSNFRLHQEEEDVAETKARPHLVVLIGGGTGRPAATPTQEEKDEFPSAFASGGRPRRASSPGRRGPGRRGAAARGQEHPPGVREREEEEDRWRGDVWQIDIRLHLL